MGAEEREPPDVIRGGFLEEATCQLSVCVCVCREVGAHSKGQKEFRVFALLILMVPGSGQAPRACWVSTAGLLKISPQRGEGLSLFEVREAFCDLSVRRNW